MKKQQIITLIIGILIGAVFTAAIFLIFKPGNSRRVPDFSGFNKDGEKLNPSNFKPGEGRSKRSKDSTEGNDNNVEDNKTVEDSKNEKQN